MRLCSEILRARVFLIARLPWIGVNCRVDCNYPLTQLQSCLDDWAVEFVQLGPTRGVGIADRVVLPSLRIARLQAGRSVVIRGTAASHHDCLIVSSSRSAPARWLGQPIDAQHFAVAGRGARVDLFLPADATLCLIEVGPLASTLAKRIQLRSGASECVSRLVSCAEAAVNTGTTQERNADEALGREVLVAMATSEVLLPDVSSRSLRISAVERACRYIDSRLSKPISLGELSKHCGVGIRTLEYGFRQFYDTTPIGFIKSQRLTRTHTALMEPKAQATSINKLARRAGFTHMGQFCQDYRALFGESPSMTLQRTPNKAVPIETETSASSTT
jgi:AraC-like DNA-binding protein